MMYGRKYATPVSSSAISDILPRKGRAEVSHETRQRLLEAAITIFVEQGYQAATLDQIAALAGHTKGAVYWHFPNKQSLFLALLKAQHEGNAARMERIFASPKEDGPGPVLTAFKAYLAEFERDDVLPLLAMELEMEARRNPEMRSVHTEMVVAFEQGLKSILGRFYQRTGLKPMLPLDMLAASIVTLVKGFALARQNRPGRQVGLASLLEHLLDMPDRQ